MKQVNIIIKILLYGISDDDMNYTLDTFWSEYTDFNHKNGSFGVDDFIWIIKDIQNENINLWHQNYYSPCTKVLVF